MLKLSKDGLKVKRRIPFDAKSVDIQSIDAATIYIEDFPEHLTHRELAKLFARAGTIRNVTMPKYKENFTSKGFAFVEFKTENEAKSAIELFDNVVPNEFTDTTCENYVQVTGQIKPLKVLSKNAWAEKKEEMKRLKREIANLFPGTMFEAKPSSRKPTEVFEDGTLLKIKFASKSALAKQALKSVVMHFGNPVYIDV